MCAENKKTVCVIFGGQSSEYEVSCRSSCFVIENLDTEKYDLVTLGITKEGEWYLYSGPTENIFNYTWVDDENNRSCIISPDRNNPGLVILGDNGTNQIDVDVYFPVLHGKNGEDGTIQGLMALSGVPYVGCGTLASAVCMDKAVTHSLLSAANIEQAHYLWFFRDKYDEEPEKIRNRIEARLNFPVFVKPANAGSSVGVSKCNTPDDLDEAIKKAAKEDIKIVVEEGIVGQEVECAVLGNRDAVASTVGEIGASAEFYDYDDKYNSGTSVTYIPAHISEEKIEEIRNIAVRAYRILGCAGLSRVDFFVQKDGKVILNEINTLPGFTSISMYPQLWQASGKTATQLIDDIIDTAFNRFE
ncbi:MAG: D-alanine--D-alanine ligase family protein [Clostridia bacterium]|nr:D-alanine--D-alanine ligase family protein [Clostridia bacterium]